MIALDLFAGTGWGVACQWLGIDEYGVEIMPEAVATRDAAGMNTPYRDVWDVLINAPLDSPEFAAALLIASPPCQTFSVAGKGAGRAALDEVLEAVAERAFEDPAKLKEFGDRHDDRTALVLTPLAYVWAHRPTYVVFEQVPPVLPVWEACAEVMRALGYSVWTGKLNAEQYGVPQTRTRAILIGRRDGTPAAPPEPTHSRYYSTKPHQLDIGVEPWVSMADALGWGMTERPMLSLAPGSQSSSGAGGPDPMMLGGSGARATVAREKSHGDWIDPVAASSGFAGGNVPRGTDQPIQTITGAGSVAVRERVMNLDPRLPVTTVAGDPRVSSRDHHEHGAQSARATRLSVAEAAVLQSYPADFPFQGTQTKQYLQIGNAVPPKLAAAILSTFIEDGAA